MDLGWINNLPDKEVKRFTEPEIIGEINTFKNQVLNPFLVKNGKNSIQNLKRNIYQYQDVAIKVIVTNGDAVFINEKANKQLVFRKKKDKFILVDKIEGFDSEFYTIQNMINFAFNYLFTKAESQTALPGTNRVMTT